MTINLIRQRLLFACAVLWIGVTPPLSAQTEPVASSGFAPLSTLIDSLRSRGEPDLSIKFDDTTFTIQQVNRSPITPEAGKALVQTSSIQEFPNFRIDDGKFFLVRHVAESTWVEQELADSTAEAHWNKKTLDPVASYPLASWTKFVDFALNKGLVHYGSLSTEHETFGYLLFAPKGVASVDYPAGTLELSDEFYRSMRLATKYPPVPGTAGFVILIHDPHSDVVGRFTLLRGLDSLFQANAGTRFCFLNEGEFPGVNPPELSGRLISDGGVHATLQALSPQSRQSAIYQLVGNFRMDVPRAFQELHFNPRDTAISRIKSYKIDDIRYLHEPFIDRVSDNNFDSALQAIFEAARSALPDSKNADLSEPDRRSFLLVEKVLITAAMERADVGKMSDEESIDFYNLLSDQLKSLVRSASAALPQSAKLSSAFATLDLKVQEHDLDVRTFRDAMLRNRTMSRLIVTAAKAPATYGGIPIAFIGSFHTKGITSVLRENNIGYIVVEPVRSTIFRAPKSEERDFARFVADRSGFLRTGGVNKGAAELSPIEVQAYVLPKLRLAARWHDTQAAVIAARVDPASTIDAGKLSSSILDNPYSIYTSVDIGGGGQLPPETPAGGFGFFEPSGDRLRLTLLGSRDERWRADDSRYRFLALVTARIPDKDPSNPNANWVEAMTLNSQDRDSGKAFVSYYDGRNNRLWLVETSMAAVSSLVSRPVKKGAQTVEYGLTTAEVNTHTNKGEDGDGDRNEGPGPGFEN
jgi:hypothetical protein